MKQKLLKTMLLLWALVVGSVSAWAQSDKSAVETSNVTLTAGTSTNGSTCTVNGETGIKVGTSSKGGDMTVTVPAGTKYLHVHAAAWKGVTGLSLNISGATSSPTSIALTADDGISNSTPFTLSGNAEDFYFVLTLSDIDKETDIKFTTSTTKRFVIWGVNYEVASYTITEATNNAIWGTVSKEDNVITAYPSDGYRVSASTPYTVSPSGSSTVSQSGNVFTVVPSANTTVTINFEAIPTHVVSVTPTSDGTITVKNGEDVVSSGSSVREGTELTITASAGVGKKFNSWSVTGATPASTTSTTTTFTVGENDITIAASFDDVTTYPVHWSVNGVVVATDNVAENDAIVFDAPASGVPEGYVFKGWVVAANRIDGTTKTEPTANYVTSADATAEITYYAVLADIANPDELTNATTGVSGTSYSEWSNKSGASGAVYAGQSAGNYSSIQLRSNNNNSGVITTKSGGKAKKVVVEWNSNTAETRTITIYGKNTAYSSASDLYGSGAGTSLGDFNVNNAVGLKSVLYITDDYEYIGIRSKDGALYLDKISIYWNETESYCTTVPTATITLADACTDGEGNHYGTYSNSSAFVVPADLTVSTISVSAGEMTLTNYNEGDIVKANTGVLVASTTSGDHTVTLAAGGTELSGNMLKASSVAMDMSDTKFYRLTMHEGTQLGFWWGAADGAAFAIDANKAYLAVPVGQTGEVRGFNLNGNADAISEIVNGKSVNGKWYDLSGRRVSKATKGIYIVNGKKVVK